MYGCEVEIVLEIDELFRELSSRGITVRVDDGNLKVVSAKGVFTPELQASVRAHKDELVRRLSDTTTSRSSIGPIVPDTNNANKPFPLADLQLGFYMADDPYMEYHVRPHYYLENDFDDLDIERYENAWNSALKRHAQDLCIVTPDVQMQRIEQLTDVRCVVHDYRSLSYESAQKRLLDYRESHRRQELPLDQWPWFHLSVSIWQDNGHDRFRVHYNHNNFFIDGFATTKLLAEIDRYYRGEHQPVEDISISFRDAVIALDRLAKSEQGEQARQYWRNRLDDLPMPPPLPQVSQLSRRVRSKLTRREGTLNPEQWAAFLDMSNQHRVTPSNVLIMAYCYVVSHWSNSDHFILSQMVTRRFAELHPQISDVIGNFASLYPLEISIDKNVSFLENALALQQLVLKDIAHLQCGGMEVLQELNRRRGGFGNAPSPYVVGSGLFMKEFKRSDYSQLETSQTLLDFQFFTLEDDSFYFVWDVIEEFFPEGMIDAMLRAFNGLIDRLSNDQTVWRTERFQFSDEEPDAAFGKLTADAMGDHSLLHSGLERLAQQNVGCGGVTQANRHVAYPELLRHSQRYALQLLEAQVSKGELVGIVMERSPELYVAAMAVLMAGAAYVPIDPKLPEKRQDALLASTQCRVMLCSEQTMAIRQWPEPVRLLSVSLTHDTELNVVDLNRLSALDIAPQDLAYVIFTSGSTGVPKGVMIDHQGAVNTILDVNERFDISSKDTILGVSAFNFDLSVYDLFGSTAASATLVFPELGRELEVDHWLELMVRENVSVWNSVPALMLLLIEIAERRNISLPSLRWVLLSGDKIPVSLPERIWNIAKNAKVVSLGGATEASIWSIMFPVNEVNADWRTIPYGYGMTNQYWRIRNNDGTASPVWTAGDLYIGGVGVTLGYWRDEEKTGSSLDMSDYQNTGIRWYKTGDVGRYWPDKCIEFLGRSDFQVKIQGHRIELGEIEAALSENESISEAVVTVHDAENGNGPQLVGHVIPTSGSVFDKEFVESSLSATLPAYMVPSTWSVVESFPLTHNGKVDRNQLNASSQLISSLPASQRTHVAPATPLEAKLVSLWEEILGLELVGAEDDFFTIGGQSFDAVRIFALLNEDVTHSLTLGDIWELRTIKRLAHKIEAGEGNAHAAPKLINLNTRVSKQEPLYLVHPAGGSVIGYSTLANCVSSRLVGVESATPLSSVNDQVSIEQLASDYIKLVRKRQPVGPYRLGGWSSGGMIAFEMAAQLESQSEQVEQLILLDAPAPMHHSELNELVLVKWFLEDLNIGLGEEQFQALEQIQGDAPLRRALDVINLSALAGLDYRQLAPVFDTFCQVVIAGMNYQVNPISGDMTVVRVADEVVSEFLHHPDMSTPDWGWARFSSGECHHLRVAGNHHTFLQAEDMSALVACIDGLER